MWYNNFKENRRMYTKNNMHLYVFFEWERGNQHEYDIVAIVFVDEDVFNYLFNMLRNRFPFMIIIV